jgi:NAD(P)H dehydrogenase (quinone)
MIIVGVPCTATGITNMKEITGGPPYGATTLANSDGSRQPSRNKLEVAQFQRRYVAEITGRLFQPR